MIELQGEIVHEPFVIALKVRGASFANRFDDEAQYTTLMLGGFSGRDVKRAVRRTLAEGLLRRYTLRTRVEADQFVVEGIGDPARLPTYHPPEPPSSTATDAPPDPADPAVAAAIGVVLDRLATDGIGADANSGSLNVTVTVAAGAIWNAPLIGDTLTTVGGDVDIASLAGEAFAHLAERRGGDLLLRILCKDPSRFLGRVLGRLERVGDEQHVHTVRAQPVRDLDHHAIARVHRHVADVDREDPAGMALDDGRRLRHRLQEPVGRGDEVIRGEHRHGARHPGVHRGGPGLPPG